MGKEERSRVEVHGQMVQGSTGLQVRINASMLLDTLKSTRLALDRLEGAARKILGQVDPLGNTDEFAQEDLSLANSAVRTTVMDVLDRAGALDGAVRSHAEVMKMLDHAVGWEERQAQQAKEKAEARAR